MTTHETTQEGTTHMDAQEIARRILAQRMHRFTDSGPDLAPFGAARFRREGSRLRVGYATLSTGRAFDAVARVQQYAGRRGMQVQWVVVPQRPGEHELVPALAAAHFHLGESLLLMAHVGSVQTRLNPAITVAPITVWQAMWEYEYGSRQAFFDEPDPSHTVVTQRARDRWREQEYGWCRYYVASIAGRQVGGCYVSLWEDIPTLMGVYTVAPARGQGVAGALIERAVADLIRPNRDVCCLFVKVGNPAERLYRELGFIGLLNEDTFAWEPGY